MPSLINSDDGVVSGSAGLKTTGSNDGILALQNNGTTNVTVTAAGNVGIGTTSPATILDVNGTITSRSVGGGEGGQLNLLNPDNASTGLTVDVSAADVGRIFSVRNNSTLMLGQLGGTGGIVSFYTAATEQARITAAGLFQFNSGYGSVATAYGCRAWVNFNGTGTPAIRASGNVSTITDNGTGDYAINFTTAMPDENYGVVCLNHQSTGNAPVTININTSRTSSASLVQISTTQGAARLDTTLAHLAILR